MDFDALISEGWSSHADRTVAVADLLAQHVGLVTDAERARKFVALANHAIGEHLGDWSRAANVIADALDPMEENVELAPALGALAVAQFLSGDNVKAMTTELRAAALAKDAVASMLRVRALIAEGLFGQKRYAEGQMLYESALSVAAAVPDHSDVHKTFAIVSNNIASNLLEMSPRTDTQDAIMLDAARAARTHWLKAGTWLNDARADYLLALVHNALGRYHDTVGFAQRGAETIESNGPAPIDAAFVQVSLAAAYRGLGDHDKQANALDAAERLANAIDDPGTRTWFDAELAKAR